VIRTAYVRTCSLGKQLVRPDGAAQLVEFAVSLPLLVLFVVGIFDFSAAFTQKQKLTNVARDAARVAAADPSADVGNLSSGLPSSVTDALKVVDSYLTANRLNDCGLSTKTPSRSGVTWTYTIAPTGNPPCGITLIINRGYVFPITSTTPPDARTCLSQAPGSQTALVGTCVSVQYAYNWKFARVASLFGRNDSLPTEISAVAVALNEN
jgi:Flp pilus assembly protein TadG